MTWIMCFFPHSARHLLAIALGLFLITCEVHPEEIVHTLDHHGPFVAAGDSALQIRLPDHQGAEGFLLELNKETLYRQDAGETIWRGGLTGQTIEIARFFQDRDRMYSSFQPCDANGSPIGAPLWATVFEFSQQAGFSFPRPETQKGLNCLVMVDDAVELGVGHVVENIVLGALVDLENPDPQLFQVVDGHRIGINAETVDQLDRRFQRYREAGIDVTGILLNRKPSPDDEAHPALVPSRAALDGQNVFILAFNLETPEGMRVYRAAVEFLAERYTRPDGRHGWMSGLIIGNEIQAHWVWHNLGRIDAETILGEYLLSLRLADIAGRSRHPDFRVFASMTHHWTSRGAADPSQGLSGVDMLTFLNENGKNGGDFPWGVAFHPYPENLFRPDFWRDATAHLALDAPKVTMRNVEVLDAFLAQPEMRFGGEMREILLSEQGYHSPPGEEGERLQAAALAYTFEKIGRMPTVRAFHLHRHVDHPEEGGLLLGLWTHAGKPETPGRRKKAWEVFRAFGTEDWQETAAPLIGLTDLSRWTDAAPVPRDQIPARFETPQEEGVVADLFYLAGEAEVTDGLDFRGDSYVKSAGWLANAIFHHPPLDGSSRARFRIQIPPAEEEQELSFSFGTALGAPSVTGVIFRVYLAGKRLFQHHHTEQFYTPHMVPLAQWAGEEIDLVLEVDANGSNTHDWAYWVEPQVLQGRVPERRQ